VAFAYDGYRHGLERNGDHVRLITRSGHNCTDRYPWTVEAAQGPAEAVRARRRGCRPGRGRGLQRPTLRKHYHEVQFSAFDILVEDDDNLRKLPLHLCETDLGRLLAPP
jgi:ATP-dependent DNA ligase